MKQQQWFNTKATPNIAAKVFLLSQSYRTSSFYTSNQWVNDAFSSFELLCGLGIEESIEITTAEQLSCIDDFMKNDYWYFAEFTYEVKNFNAKLSSKNPGGYDYPAMHLFIPQVVIGLKDDQLFIEAENPALVWERILNISVADFAPVSIKNEVHCFTTKQEYIKNVKAIQEEIRKGNVYEMNYCIEFYIPNIELNTIALFHQVNATNANPFSAYIRNKYLDILCFSPERFLTKKENKLTCQPMKGTAAIGTTKIETLQLAQALQENDKERAENIMIVDLMRNDLSRVGIPGTTKVTDLCKVLTFDKVLQMISTVETELQTDIDFSQILEATFPMGSMTGAPKIAAMEFIENFENRKRGLYSGSIGYIQPNKDFDFNVVIRSLMYDRKNQSLSLHVGSAITILSNPADEYNECLIKAKTILSSFEPKD